MRLWVRVTVGTCPWLCSREASHSAPSPALSAIASAPQNVMRVAPTFTPAPPARAANPPKEREEDQRSSRDEGGQPTRGTKVVIRRGMAVQQRNCQSIPPQPSMRPVRGRSPLHRGILEASWICELDKTVNPLCFLPTGMTLEAIWDDVYELHDLNVTSWRRC